MDINKQLNHLFDEHGSWLIPTTQLALCFVPVVQIVAIPLTLMYWGYTGLTQIGGKIVDTFG